jgi:acyl-CoA dehydrogenase
MNLDLAPQDVAFRDEVRAFLAEHLTPELQLAQDMTTTVFAEPEITGEWHRKLHARGWVAPLWPREHGGPGWSGVQRYLFDRECQLAGAPSVSPMGVRMVGPVIIGFGSPEQKARYLPRILSGEDAWCQGYSEPQAGSDLASLKTRARRDGDSYVVNGTKIWTTHAHHADMMFALVRTDDSGRKQEGISFLLVDMKSPGISVRPIRTIGGEHEVNQVFLDDVRVPVANRVGDEGAGWSYGKYLLEFERGGGFAAARLERLAGKVRALLRAGEPQPWALERLAHLATDIEALEMLELQIVAGSTAGTSPGVMASVLKLRASELRQALCRLALDVAGPAALYWESARPLHRAETAPVARELLPVASTYLNSRAFTIFGGSSEMQRDILAKSVLGL